MSRLAAVVDSPVKNTWKIQEGTGRGPANNALTHVKGVWYRIAPVQFAPAQ